MDALFAIRRAYDELERSGYAEKIHGRGTSVRYRPLASASRKEQAIRRFTGPVITCSYELDEGSFLYLQEKTKRILEAKAS